MADTTDAPPAGARPARVWLLVASLVLAGVNYALYGRMEAIGTLGLGAAALAAPRIWARFEERLGVRL